MLAKVSMSLVSECVNTLKRGDGMPPRSLKSINLTVRV